MLQGINQGSAGILRLMYFGSIKAFFLKFNWPGNSTFRLFISKITLIPIGKFWELMFG